MRLVKPTMSVNSTVTSRVSDAIAAGSPRLIRLWTICLRHIERRTRARPPTMALNATHRMVELAQARARQRGRSSRSRVRIVLAASASCVIGAADPAAEQHAPRAGRDQARSAETERQQQPVELDVDRLAREVAADQPAAVERRRAGLRRGRRTRASPSRCPVARHADLAAGVPASPRSRSRTGPDRRSR